MLGCLVVAVCVSLVAGMGEPIDLTHQLDTKSLVWPNNPPLVFTIISRQQTPNFWFEFNKISTIEHIGTHLDSPAHLSKGKWRVHQIPLNHLMGPGVVIDISERAKNDPDAQVQINDILQWEEQHGKLPKRAMVLMRSGWSKNWPNATEVFGTAEVNDSTTFHFPGFSPATAQWLVDNRNYINAIGVDTPSLDFGQSRNFESHVTVFGANIYGLENVANLEKVPASGSTIYAMPLKLFDGSGSPTRIFATLNDISAASSVKSSVGFLLCSVLAFVLMPIL